MPKISVIVACYNSEKYLHKSIGSLINQSLSNIELIFVDDGSTDNSLKILKDFSTNDERITIIKSKHYGAAAARNTGVSIAMGKYLAILDSDDTFDNNMLYEMYHHAEKYNSDIILYPYRYATDNIQTKRGIALPRENINLNCFNPADISKDLFQITSPNAWSKLFLTSHIQKNSIRFQDITSCNDVFFTYYALALSQKISLLNKSFVAYRSNAKNSISSNRGSNSKNIITAFEKLRDDLFNNNNNNNNNNKYINSLSRRALRCFEYELQFIEQPSQLYEFYNNAGEFIRSLTKLSHEKHIQFKKNP